ncbi:helix-turn-helix transcriptional regulator [Flagellimonas marinaquae]|mgnify:CR=1 FL=1|nr:transcriptional regulator [Allomuricauda sp.]UBZ14608.1 helix-turn-helix transcriptional regulator [Allomuricauda aquimarina]|tara:strand:+ start:346 stop:684 length:339 start_codon:yes stop_codon:yes gene_type:complete
MGKSNTYIEIQSVMDALEIIGGKWKFPIIYSLCQSKKRFNELQADLKGVSPRALSNALKDLEVNGLVNREVFPTVPTTVEYSLTDYGDELETVLVAIQDWGKKHRERIIGKF